MTPDPFPDDESQFIAVVGLAGRFPGARDTTEFWANLMSGVESLTALPAADEFDAEFFGCTDADALLLDPQQRVFLETCWEALEDAGCDPDRAPGAIGVYAGSSETLYATALRAHRSRLAFVSDRQIRTATGLDFLATRVAYKLGLRGPAMTVLTACSTALVAVHTAASALLAGDCDMALAGGVTVHLWRDPDDDGDGMIASDGHCRAFDASATGTVFSDGAGVVVLKRLADARRDGDHVRAVLRGSAVNNDGSAKVGFFAPGVDGQAVVVRQAHLAAGVDPATIGYVEAHGTGTPLGDPVEIAALTRAFRAGTDQVGYCRIGSVKTNIGHTDAAAGAAGLIKAVLALEHGMLPPSLNFERANPDIDFAGSPFTVVTRPQQWPRGRWPRRAGVNSLGIGGTNAHLVLEEAPPPPRPAHDGVPQLLVLSARTEPALAAASTRLAARLRERPAAGLADVAWTLHTGRRAHPHRRFVVAGDHTAAARALTSTGAADLARPRSVALLFPGLGGQRAGLGARLYAREPVFRAAIDECADLALPRLGLDLRDLVRASTDDELARANHALDDIGVGQPAVFAVEHALAALLRSWGVRPDVLVGHSLGAYAAACAAGVFTLPDALRLVVERGRLLRSVPSGAMLAVPLPEAEVTALLADAAAGAGAGADAGDQIGAGDQAGGGAGAGVGVGDPAGAGGLAGAGAGAGAGGWVGADGLAVTVVNSPTQCVVAGPPEAVEALRRRLDQSGVDGRLLRVPVPAHSRYVQPVLAEFADLVRELRPQPPRIPLLSELTGQPLSDAEATDPGYWAQHLRRAVRFDRVLAELFRQPDQVLVEVGPGQALTSVVRRHPDRPDQLRAVPTTAHRHDPAPDDVALLAGVGALWAAGVEVDWAALHGDRPRRRVPLPGYPFQRRRYRVDPPTGFAAPPDPTPIAPAPRVEATPEPAADPGFGGTEDAVAAAFRAVLGRASVRRDDSLFTLGGDSVIAAQVVRALRHTTGVSLPLRAVFENPTVAGLARWLDLLRDTAPPDGELATR